MTAMTLFYIAIIVFSLLITGLYLSIREFLEASNEPSKVKGVDRDRVSVKRARVN